jgi:hypothetical protein
MIQFIKKIYLKSLLFYFVSGLILNTVVIRAQFNEYYKPGEALEYEMAYGWIVGGIAQLELNETYFNGQKVYHGKGKGFTIGIADKLYSVMDIYESYFDQQTGLPLKSIMNIKEGKKYKRYNEVLFNHSNNTVISQKKGEVHVKKDVFDIISAFYYLRRMPLDNIKVGDVIRIETYFQDEPWQMVIRFYGYETIKLKIGKINCMKFKPIVQVAGTFKDEESLSIWISNDKNRIPIRAKMNLLIGAFKVDLVKYIGLIYEPELID